MGSAKWFKSLAGFDVGDYKLRSYIGHGRIGYVYLANHREIDDLKRAVKLTKGRLRKGWKNELMKVGSLSTIPGVVHFHHMGTAQISFDDHTEVLQYTVWDYIHPGHSLTDYLTSVEACSTSFLVAVLERILRVLHACQKKGVMRHGDLHAGNILVGEKDDADLDLLLRPREPIFVSDFGYGATGGRPPKDDYVGLAEIVDAMIEKVEWDAATATDRHMLGGIHRLLAKLLKEDSQTERRTPIEILEAISELKRKSQGLRTGASLPMSGSSAGYPGGTASVGQFQVSEMLGDDWEWWKKLFVAAVPARSRILEPYTATRCDGTKGLWEDHAATAPQCAADG